MREMVEPNTYKRIMIHEKYQKGFILHPLGVSLR